MRINPLWLQNTKPKSGKGNNLNLITEAIRIASWIFEIASFEACQLLAIEYQNTCTTFHQEGYFQRSILKYFPATQLPLVILNQLTSIGVDAKGQPINLHRKYQAMSLKKEHADKSDQIRTASLGEKVSTIFTYK